MNLEKYYKTNREGEVYTLLAYDNGDTYTHNNLNENEYIDLEATYQKDGFEYRGKIWHSTTYARK